MTTHEGHCLCGAVRFTAEVVSTRHSACHCGMCRRWAGGTPFFGVRTRDVKFEGGEHITRFESSGWADRGFCARCGTHLFYFLKPLSTYMMGAGTFDDAAGFELASEIFIDEKPPGYAFAGDHPRLTAAETLAKFAPKS